MNKFRAWNKEDESWIDIKSLGMIEGEITILEEWDDDLPYFIEDLGKTWELMQSTGLTDKNGKEIFEGDILRIWIEDEYIPNRDSGGGIIDYDCEPGFSQIGKVEFEGSSFDYSTVKTLSGNHEEIHLSIDWLSNYEVIGNVHEHPDLLGEPS